MIFDTSDKYFRTVVEDCEKREELRRKGIRAEAVTGALLESSKSSKILAITTPHFTLARGECSIMGCSSLMGCSSRMGQVVAHAATSPFQTKDEGLTSCLLRVVLQNGMTLSNGLQLNNGVALQNGMTLQSGMQLANGMQLKNANGLKGFDGLATLSGETKVRKKNF
jgi:hypothetical protein